MMQEYDDDFFFEEDKIHSPRRTPTQNENLHVKPKVPEVTEIRAPTAENDPECIFNDLRRERYLIQYQDLMGMTVTSGSIMLVKDEKNLIGISIGGGAPVCPCLYIVQIFDNTPAWNDGTLQSGDELVGVNGQSVKGKTKVEVAKMIQAAKEEVTINFNKLHADPKQGKSLDIIMKKMKHRLVEKLSSGAADALGLSRAILCNDTLVAKLKELQKTEEFYKKLVEHAKRMLKSHFDVMSTYKALGDVFAAIGVREPQARASEAFSRFGQYHRLLERDGIKMLKTLKPILADMGTYLNKAIPDTKLTIKKYADTKFEYLSYCLKVKEMDDEEYGYNALQEPLYRVETGNYEYRLILRCRQDARARFAQLRTDVLIKLELLYNKRSQDIAYQLRRLVEGLAVYHRETFQHLNEHATLFPVEVDLSQDAFQYKSTTPFRQDSQDEDDVEEGKEIQEYHDIDVEAVGTAANRRTDKDGTELDDTLATLLPNFPSPSENKKAEIDTTTLLNLPATSKESSSMISNYELLASIDNAVQEGPVIDSDSHRTKDEPLLRLDDFQLKTSSNTQVFANPSNSNDNFSILDLPLNKTSSSDFGDFQKAPDNNDMFSTLIKDLNINQ